MMSKRRFIVTTIPMPAGGAEVRALHHAYDAAQLLAFGLLSASLAQAWDRWGSNHRAARWLALAVASIAVGALVLPIDCLLYTSDAADE